MRMYHNRDRVSEREINRYLRGVTHRQSKKDGKNGIIGISKHKNGFLWYAMFPPYLRIRRKGFSTALGAAMEYNRQMLALFGEDAVLCDVNAAMELDRRRK